MTPPIVHEGEGGESNSSGDRSSQRAKSLDVEQKGSIGDEASSTVKIPTKFNASPVHLVHMKKTIKTAEIVANLPTFEEIQRKNIPTKLSLLEKPSIPTASPLAGTTTDHNPAVLQKAVQSHGTDATAYNGKDISPPVPGSTSVPVRHHEPLPRAFQVPPSTTRSPQPKQKSLPTQLRTLPTQPKQTHVQPKAGMQHQNHAGQQLNQNMGPPKAMGNHPRSTVTVNSSLSSASQQQQSDFLMTLDGTQTWAAPSLQAKIKGHRESNVSSQHEEEARRKAIATQNAIAIARARQAEPIEVRQVQNQSLQGTSRPYGRQGPRTLGPFELALKEARRMEQHAVHQAIHQPESYEMAQRRRSETQSHQGVSLNTQDKQKELQSPKFATQAQHKAMPTGEAGSRRNSVSSTGPTPHSVERYLRLQYANSLTGEAQSAEKNDAAKDVLPVHPPIPHSPFEATTAFLKDEAAMSTLVRKLLGRVPVEGDECPVVLDGALISALSDKIRLVVHKLVDMQVDPQTTKKRSAMEIGKHEIIDLSTDDDDDGEGQQRTKRLKAFAMRQSQLLEEEKATVARLRRALADKEDVIKEQAKEAAYIQTYSKSEETSATVQNLVNQLDEGMKTVQRQKQEILSLRTVINQDAADLKEKDRTIEKLRQQLLSKNESQPAAVPPDTLLELVELKEELKTISETLKRERRVNESNARSYMRAAVHAVKIHNRRTDKCDNKGRPAS